MDPSRRRSRLLQLLGLLLLVTAFSIRPVLQSIRNTREAGPRDFRRYIDLGNLYTRQADYIRAEQAYWAGLRSAGIDAWNTAALHDGLGTVYERERNPGESWAHRRAAYEIRKTLGPTDDWANDSTYQTYRAAHGNKTGYMKWIEHEGDNLPPELSRRSDSLRNRLTAGDYAGVLADSNRFLQLNPGSHFTYHFLEFKATALSSLKQWDAAIKILRQLEPRYLPPVDALWLQHTLGYCLINQGENEEGLRYIQRLIREHPDYPRIGELRLLEKTAASEAHAPSG